MITRDIEKARRAIRLAHNRRDELAKAKARLIALKTATKQGIYF